jgi:hypothetical protein
VELMTLEAAASVCGDDGGLCVLCDGDAAAGGVAVRMRAGGSQPKKTLGKL